MTPSPPPKGGDIGMCPHCHYWHSPWPVMKPMCPDRRRWTQEEKDALRARIIRERGYGAFAPSTAEMQDRFGARNRADRLAAEAES